MRMKDLGNLAFLNELTDTFQVFSICLYIVRITLIGKQVVQAGFSIQYIVASAVSFKMQTMLN